MAYTPGVLKEIRKAERTFYEQVFVAAVQSLEQHLAHDHFREEVGGVATDMSRETTKHEDWIEERCFSGLDRWRLRFAPSRVGLPLESEWD
jgi:hypothetical protein